jgi:putative glycosyltransferase (TIGR04348 family)
LKILVVTPAARESRAGNRVTADRWARILRRLGHRVTVTDSYTTQTADLLIALHARKSAPAVRRFRTKYPERPIIVAMTGTDLHHDLPNSQSVIRSIAIADRLVLLEPSGLQLLPKAVRQRTHVIFQSAEQLKQPVAHRSDCFEVCVIGHLRPVKDPFRTAMAVRQLPSTSRIMVTHLGAALTPAMRRRAERETERNSRYRWHNNCPRRQTLQILARSRALVLTSKSEGGPNVLCEAVLAGTPVISSRIAGAVGMLGDEYPGYFPVGDTRALADLLSQCERSRVYCSKLIRAGRARRKLFTPQREQNGWARLLREL